jgi:cyclopropane-fatty-acyl-phospholipid synthase
MDLIDLCERGLIPDRLTRFGIRRLCAQRLREETAGGSVATRRRFDARLAQLRISPIAIHPEAANEQHYELPPAFFERCLGPRLKYSSCLFPGGRETLAEAEERMLALYLKRAELDDGQAILELGCGWGSLTLWMAERLPRARIVAVSNSRPQREYIEARCRQRGLANVRLLTADVNRLELDERFDRVVSIEMFEHMRNYESLLARIASWMRPRARLFVHMFCHRELMYPFRDDGRSDWMARHFFTGGLMPAADTLAHFQRDLKLEQRWLLPGTHYQRTAEAWLVNHDRERAAVLEVLAACYGREGASLWHQRWRMFWMACAELFGYRGGSEWQVAHYRFAKP